MDDADIAQDIAERQMESGLRDYVLARRAEGARLAQRARAAGEGSEFCEVCGGGIAEGRRRVVPGVRLCCACQAEIEKAMGR